MQVITLVALVIATAIAIASFITLAAGHGKQGDQQ